MSSVSRSSPDPVLRFIASPLASKATSTGARALGPNVRKMGPNGQGRWTRSGEEFMASRWTCAKLTRCSRGTRSASATCPTPATGWLPARSNGWRRCASPSAAASGCWPDGPPSRRSPPSSAWPGDPASLAAIEIRTIIGGEAQGAPEVFVDGVRCRDRHLLDRPSRLGRVHGRRRRRAGLRPGARRAPLRAVRARLPHRRANRPPWPLRRSRCRATRSPTSSGRPRRAH